MRSAIAFALLLTCSDQPNTNSSRATDHPSFDIIIRHGDVIAVIGDLSHTTAATTLEATNHVVAPGFIDLLGHSEGSVLIDPHLEGKIRQGVTTERQRSGAHEAAGIS